MHTVQRQRWLSFSPDTIYNLLTDESKFAQVVKRIDQLTVIERNGINGRLSAIIDLPGGKSITTEGEVTGQDNEYIQFETKQPFPMTIRWQLVPQFDAGESGTLVEYSIGIDLSPILSVMPNLVLNGFLSAEMDQDLERLFQALSTENQMI